MKKKLWKKLCAPANLCTIVRIAGAAALWLTRPETAGFYAIYALSGLSDALDGWLARRTGSADDFGARLDSAADLLFYGSMLLYMLPALWLRLPGWVWIMLAAVLAIRLCAYAAGAVRERRFTALHTIPNKLTGLMVFLVPFALRTPWTVGYCAAACIVAAVAALHEMSLHLCAPQRAVEREAQAE